MLTHCPKSQQQFQDGTLGNAEGNSTVLNINFSFMFPKSSVRILRHLKTYVNLLLVYSTLKPWVKLGFGD
jgi:hypothetical protein